MMKEREQQRIFDDWLSRHKGLLFKVVRAYAFTIHDRDDLFQEIARQVWHSVPKFRGESAETTWLYRVALYAAISWSKRERKHREKNDSLDGVELTLTETKEVNDTRLVWLYEQIAQLDEIDRSLTLLLFDGFSYRDMAETLGITESNVGVKINRIKAHLTRKSKKEIHNGL
jgi:RNA polymerase sigma-70 factor (ECF subfamily)